MTMPSAGRWEGYTFHAHADGVPRIAHLSLSRLEEGQERLGYVGIAHDVTRFSKEISGSAGDVQLTPNTARAHGTSLNIFRRLVTAVARMAEARDPDIAGHLERVQTLVRWLLAALHPASLSAEEREWVAIRSMLHDVGKIMIPEGILFKPGPLLPEEYQLMQMHAVFGDRLLREILAIPGFEGRTRLAAEIARWHHERWDGGGYPDKLQGSSIAVHARVVALADVVDALLSPRAYKLPWSWPQVVQYGKEQWGRQFCPDVVDAFFHIQRLVQDLHGMVERRPTAQA